MVWHKSGVSLCPLSMSPLRRFYAGQDRRSRSIEGPHQPGPSAPDFHAGQTKQDGNWEGPVRPKRSRQQIPGSVPPRTEPGASPQALLHQRVSAQAVRDGLRSPGLPRSPRPGEWIKEHAAPAGHRPASRPLQAGTAHRPLQPEPARLRQKGPQQEASLPSPDPGLIQPPAVVRAGRLQVNPGALLPQREGPAPLHPPQLRHGPSPSPLSLLLSSVCPRQGKKRGIFPLFS